MDKQTTATKPEAKERTRVYTARHTFAEPTGSKPVVVRANHRGWQK